MRVFRILAVAFAAITSLSAAPASAQFFLKPADLSGPRVTGNEPGILGQTLTGATQTELDAALVWNLRAALNVAALQCRFAPSLFTREYYNSMLEDHAEELAKAYKTLGGYFERTSENKKQGVTAFDQYGTRLYSGFSTVGGQLSFCQVASDIGKEVLFSPRGSIDRIAHERMYELRRSLLAWGDQAYRGYFALAIPRLPNFNDDCWDESEYRAKRCGDFFASNDSKSG
ncbi:hypothetical protein [Stakelama pacifica]|uniref:Uncharacterized protein n=1 Tax=Stakelama pacifica TaxID=517720 RepID=A0A4R6FS05_9SPHN|nr:hypothetical protein [Stakelama pacifica]TDN84549.1 hypothetical protein EV664_103194 [Stakelama pacifica]GGO93490.1 hypothetical protein GCM10011329_13030 [Stakelama pacifica]